jgi:glutathione synthase/RimK-type ligase-like ATP-grasp enzyme
MQHLLEFADYFPVKTHEHSIGILGDLGKSQKFGEQTEYFKRLAQAAQALGIDCFVFTDFNKSQAVAWHLEGDNWVQSYRLLPTIFYDRSFRKKTASLSKSNTRVLSELGCTPINSANFRKLALDKHLTYSKLSEMSIDGLNCPYTEKFSRSGVVPFLADRSNCILKPRFGSGGTGIIRIDKTPTGYALKFSEETAHATESDLIKTILEIRSRMKTLDRSYVIQELVDVPTYRDSVFDVRVIYQRGSNGEPLRTGMAVRQAAPNRITSNLHKGGNRATLSQTLTEVFGQDLNGPIADSIRESARKVFEFMDSEVGPIGEVGMDFLIDRTGGIHLIEVNSIPGRSLFEILPSIKERAIRRPVEYAAHLLNKKAAN